MCARPFVFAFDGAVLSEHVKWVHTLTEATSSSLKASSETLDHVSAQRPGLFMSRLCGDDNRRSNIYT